MADEVGRHVAGEASINSTIAEMGNLALQAIDNVSFASPCSTPLRGFVVQPVVSEPLQAQARRGSQPLSFTAIARIQDEGGHFFWRC